MAIVKKLARIGNSYGLILSRDTLHLVGINPKEGCRISIEKNRVTVEPRKIDKNMDEEVASSMLRFMKKYRSDLKKLA